MTDIIVQIYKIQYTNIDKISLKVCVVSAMSSAFNKGSAQAAVNPILTHPRSPSTPQLPTYPYNPTSSKTPAQIPTDPPKHRLQKTPPTLQKQRYQKPTSQKATDPLLKKKRKTSTATDKNTVPKRGTCPTLVLNLRPSV